jgi:uncharacterized protein (TIGR02231 family)
MQMRTYCVLLKATFLLLTIFFSQSVLAKEPIPVDSRVEQVTVYFQGAMVTRAGKLKLPAGRNLLKLQDLSSSLDAESIQFSASGTFTILSVQHQLNYLSPPKPDAEIAAVQQSQKKLNYGLLKAKALLSALQEEESLLLANKQIGGSDHGVDVDQLKSAAALYRERLREVKLAIVESNIGVAELQDSLQQLQFQLQQLNAQQATKAVSEVLVTIDAQKAISGSFELSYFVQSASWSPLYDIRVLDTNQPVEIDYKAKVLQQSGEDWKKAKLTLSTSNPTAYSQPPVLQPWWLDFYYPKNYAAQSLQKPRMMPKSEALEMEDAYYKEQQAGGPSVTVTDQTTSFQYEVKEPYTIPSDGQHYVVSLGAHQLAATYEYFCAPKYSPYAFLNAKVTDWEQYRLLPGEANLFLEGTYLGKSYINPNIVTDTLNLSLGRDEGIRVERKKGKQYAERQFIGNKQTKTIAWDIEVRNNKRNAIAITIADQFPVSTNEQIEVELGKIKGAKVDSDKGYIFWNLKLKAGKGKTLTHLYKVKYPKGNQVILE